MFNLKELRNGFGNSRNEALWKSCIQAAENPGAEEILVARLILWTTLSLSDYHKCSSALK